MNNFKQKLQEGSSLDTPEKEEQRFNLILDKAINKINGIVDRISINNDNLLQDRFEASEELIIRVIEQQYKMASDAKTQDYGDIVKKCGKELQRLIQNQLKDAYQSANTSLTHINGKPIDVKDFNIGVYMKLASEKTGINFKTLLVA